VQKNPFERWLENIHNTRLYLGQAKILAQGAIGFVMDAGQNSRAQVKGHSVSLLVV